jgi:glycosyltransferase involved in cell wall biosynthesis
MRISVITVSFNSARTIQECIESVLSQSGSSFQYMVVDGNSRDQTNNIVRDCIAGNKQAEHLIESDKGIYDAMNKGVAKSTGDVIGFLNSDDIFADDLVLHDIRALFETSSADVVYGDIEIFSDDANRSVLRSWQAGQFVRGALKYGWHPPHPAFYMKRSLFEALGGFDLSVGLSADYDLMVRALIRPDCKVAYLNRVLVKMRHGGASTSGIGPVLNGWQTCQKPWQKLGMPYKGVLAATLKPLRKLMQVRL